ncbi:MAG: IS110 family transposase, partial [Campylobacterota bacterium]|nr:IS110 family transposase [Campylobacterota bacterium]
MINRSAIEIQEMLNSHEAILKSKQRFKNQIEATGKDNKELRAILNTLVDELENKAQELFEKIEQLILQEDETKLKYEAISSIPSIGQKSALYLIAFFMKYPIANTKQLTALIGLDPVMKESGTFKGKQRLSKQGGEQLRTLMFMPTLSATIHNDRIKAFYQRLTQNLHFRQNHPVKSYSSPNPTPTNSLFTQSSSMFLCTLGKNKSIC